MNRLNKVYKILLLVLFVVLFGGFMDTSKVHATQTVYADTIDSMVVNKNIALPIGEMIIFSPLLEVGGHNLVLEENQDIKGTVFVK